MGRQCAITAERQNMAELRRLSQAAHDVLPVCRIAPWLPALHSAPQTAARSEGMRAHSAQIMRHAAHGTSLHGGRPSDSS